MDIDELRRFQLVAIGCAGIGAVLFALSWRYKGPVETMLYAVLFVFSFALIPSTIGVLGHATPGNTLLGKLHVILGALAYNHHYLVQLDDKWVWCPGDRDGVHIEECDCGEDWHELVGGHEHRSVLGWRPFGILRHKDAETLTNVRADARGEVARGTSADGGTVERAGYTEESAPAVDGLDGDWLVDLKRVYGSGIDKIGDIDLIETAEEIIERGQVDAGTMSEWRAALIGLAGIVIGVVVGFVYLTVS